MAESRCLVNLSIYGCPSLHLGQFPHDIFQYGLDSEFPSERCSLLMRILELTSNSRNMFGTAKAGPWIGVGSILINLRQISHCLSQRLHLTVQCMENLA